MQYIDMIKLVYGTNNPAKYQSMKKRLIDFPLNIININEIKIELWEPDESADNPLANAELKALGYFSQIKKPVFSCDSGLYFDEVSDEDQPGVHIRRIHGQNLKDEEFVDYYSKLAAKYGGRLTAHYRNAICMVINEKTIYKYDGVDIESPKFYIVEKAHKKYKEGYPLDSISVHIESGEYYYDLKQDKYGWGRQEIGYRNFFLNSLDLIKIKEQKK